MQYLYRTDRENPDSLVEIPFHQNRPLSDAEFKACAEHYSMARREEYLARLLSSQHGRRPQNPTPKQWPDLEGLGLSPEELWNYTKARLQLELAETKQQQKQARKWVNALAKKGPNKVRQALAKARGSILQAKRILSGSNRFNLFDYRAKRQFLWIFLRKESQWGKEELKEIKESDVDVQALVKAYSYLAEINDFEDLICPKKDPTLIPPKVLDLATIAAGLRSPHQADKEAAKKFGIKASSVRSLLSKSVRR